MTESSKPQGALSHLKVLDLSRVLAGPWCTQMLADLGADVVKVERPGVGDDTRHWGPPFLKDGQGHDTDQASYFTACNRNKRSITIDMAKSEGQALIRQMALSSDILVENFKVGGLAHYGLDYASLQAINPRLIYCSVTGFGQDGPYAERAGYDLMIQAMTGMMSITGRPDAVPGGGPLRVGVALTDLFTGVYATSAILAALEVRNRTGAGQHIDMALLDVGMAILANQAGGFLNSGAVPQRQGNSHPSLAPYQDFPTADGAMLLAVGNDGQFARFCQAVERPDWAADPRFATNTLRVKHRTVLIPAMEAVTRTRSTAQWIALLEDKAVPCG
ncbi:MAG: CaiB/BaiF CoA-transferase family protein, partial [Actinomycetota bacterium]|nr:CaiB/BaiF CoA-transferase family protein [Actinomycetota bacterium]